MALSATCQEIAYLTQFLKDVAQHEFVLVNIEKNNEGAIALVKNPVKHIKSKHIDIRYNVICDCYQSHKIMMYSPNLAKNVCYKNLRIIYLV